MQTDTDDIIDDIKSYIEIQLELAKHKAVERGAEVSAAAFSFFIYLLVFCLALVFLSIAVALLLSSVTGSILTGFLIVAGLYVVTAWIMYLTKNKWLRSRFVNNLISTLYA